MKGGKATNSQLNRVFDQRVTMTNEVGDLDDLGKQVGDIEPGWDVLERENTLTDLLPHIVIPNTDVLRTLGHHEIFGQRNTTLIVLKHTNRARDPPRIDKVGMHNPCPLTFKIQKPLQDLMLRPHNDLGALLTTLMMHFLYTQAFFQHKF